MSSHASGGTHESVADQIERFVRDHFRVAVGDTRFSRTEPLFDLGYVDSVGVIELLEFIRQHFDVQIPDEMLLSDEFATINGMASVISRLRSSTRTSG